MLFVVENKITCTNFGYVLNKSGFDIVKELYVLVSGVINMWIRKLLISLEAIFFVLNLCKITLFCIVFKNKNNI